MAYNFSNGAPPLAPGGVPGATPLSSSAPGTSSPALEASASAVPPAPGHAPDPTAPGGTPDGPVSAALLRFRSCRWQQPKEGTGTEFCTHREVKPYAGTTGFDADAWCQDCQHYKLRRAPKKRNPDEDYSY